MKKYFYLLSAALTAFSMTACSGSSDDEEGGDDNGEYAKPYYISVDKNEIEANGTDAATFILKDAKGRTINTEENLGKVYYKNVDTDETMARKTTQFTSIENGTYKFKGMYMNEWSENEVVITAKNRQKYEKYYRKVALYDITGVNCPNCPSMTAALNSVSAPMNEHMVILAFHGYTNDPYELKDASGNALSDILLSQFGGTGYPSLIINLNKLFTSSRSGTEIAKDIKEQIMNYPAQSGVKIESKFVDGQLNIKGYVAADKAGEFNLGYAILLDNEKCEGSGSVDGIYNHIVMGCSTNYNTFINSDKLTLSAGQEGSKEWNVEATKSNLEAYKDRLRIAVFSVRKNGNGCIIDNITECKAGASVDYILNN